MTIKHPCLFVLSALLVVGPALAQQPAPSQYPILDNVAAKVIKKYQTSTCMELAVQKIEKPTGEQAAAEQRVLDLLKSDPQMRKAFLDQVAAPIAGKLLECGMIP